MEAIRQTVKVKNHTFKITLPEGFDAEEVDVIIMPSEKKLYEIPQWQIDQVKERRAEYLKNPSIGQDFYQAMKEIEDEL
jgi:predicted metal-dependent hydrolase